MRCKKSSRAIIGCIHGVGFALAAVVFFPFCASAQSAGLVEQARKEGQVVIYTTMPVALFEIFQRAAKEKYPFLNIQHIYLSSSRQVSRVMLEHRAGKIQADVLGNSLEGMYYYKDQKLLGKYESPELKAMVDGAVDPERMWFGMTTDFLITGFNTRMISKAEAPKSYDD
jgi:iron(III) transport system substrate-binding protein